MNPQPKQIRGVRFTLHLAREPNVKIPGQDTWPVLEDAPGSGVAPSTSDAESAFNAANIVPRDRERSSDHK